jgi:hypothetical protein
VTAIPHTYSLMAEQAGRAHAANRMAAAAVS